MTGIIDYNAGNIRSVEQALDSFKAPFILSKDPRDLATCDRVIFPGVGDAAYAMKQLHLTGFDSFLHDWTAAGKELLGICLGSQIIFDYSEEGDTQCLGLLKGSIQHFDTVWEKNKCTTEGLLKVPHVGWNDISYCHGGSPLLAGIPEQSNFYFVHSYLIQPEDTQIIKATAEYGCPVPACVAYNTITAFQFHPEKSGTCGIRILQNFVRTDLKEQSC
jgi:imidazole glycerol-phosphate synthase subunit HisH